MVSPRGSCRSYSLIFLHYLLPQSFSQHFFRNSFRDDFQSSSRDFFQRSYQIFFSDYFFGTSRRSFRNFFQNPPETSSGSFIGISPRVPSIISPGTPPESYPRNFFHRLSFQNAFRIFLWNFSIISYEISPEFFSGFLPKSFSRDCFYSSFLVIFQMFSTGDPREICPVVLFRNSFRGFFRDFSDKVSPGFLPKFL